MSPRRNDPRAGSRSILDETALLNASARAVDARGECLLADLLLSTDVRRPRATFARYAEASSEQRRRVPIG